MDTALLNAYRATRVEVALADGDFLLPAADEPAVPLPAALSPSAWILTAWNPWSQKLSPAENQARNEELEATLQGMKVVIWPAVGRAREGDWWEASFVVVGLGMEEAMALGRRFGQNAIFRVTEEGLVVWSCLESSTTR